MRGRILWWLASESFKWSCTTTAAFLLLALAAWALESRPVNAPTPKLITESIELTLAENESEVPTEASTPSLPTPPPMPTPSQAAYLLDDTGLPALPTFDTLTPPTLPLPPPDFTPPALPTPDSAPEDVALPEITLPPALPAPMPPQVEAPKKEAPKASAGATARMENPKLLTDLTRLLKRYPPEARRNGWEGTVILKLEINEKGRLEKATLHRSSGHDVLDRAALQMIRSARFEGGPGTLLQPIEYHLR